MAIWEFRKIPRNSAMKIDQQDIGVYPVWIALLLIIIIAALLLGS